MTATRSIIRTAPLLLAILLLPPSAAPAAETPGELLGESLEQPQRTRFADPPGEPADFTLTDHDGRDARFSDLRGGPLLVFFGFTNCPDVCPATMQVLRQVLATLESGSDPATPRPTVVLISVDGERDTPEAMKAFLAPFGPDFLGLTGPPRAVREVATEFSAVFFKGGQADHHGGYNVEHTTQIYLIDSEGRLRATFYNAPIGDIVAVTHHFRRRCQRARRRGIGHRSATRPDLGATPQAGVRHRDRDLPALRRPAAHHR